MKPRFWTACCLVVLAASAALAEVPTTVVVEGLNNPCGVAIQPETGDLFVADSGALRVVRIVDGKAEPVITDFPKDVYGKGPMFDIGPLGLAFLSKDVLVVGGGGKPDGEEMLRVYKVPEKGGEPIKADAMEASFMLEPTEEIKGEGNFYALAVTKDAVFVTANGDDTKGWVAKATLEGTKVTKFERSIATKEATEVDAPVGATISPRGELVVGQMGEINVPNDSLLTFYDAADGKMLANFKTNLHDITAVAYSPDEKDVQLYATDFAWADTAQGGLFRLVAIDDNYEECKAKKMCGLDKPTAMVFDDKGDLYVTVCGTSEEGGPPGGKLLKIDGAKLAEEDQGEEPKDEEKKDDGEDKKDDADKDKKDKDDK